MKNLFEKWKEKTPNYDIQFRELLFNRFTRTGGGAEQTREDRGKQFSNNYELYIYSFFLGLYKSEFQPIPQTNNKVNFSMSIKTWGSKTNVFGRKDFTSLQENMFIAVLAKTDIDLIALEKGDLDEDNAVKALIKTMEAYTNGGLIMVKEKLEDNPNYFLQPTSFLDMILETTNSERKKSSQKIRKKIELEHLYDNSGSLQIVEDASPNSPDLVSKFLNEQEKFYDLAISDIRTGQKSDNWIWKIFPQIKGFDNEEKSVGCIIKNLDEAKVFLNHEILGSRLNEVSKELLKLNKNSVNKIFDASAKVKLQSCMTLFLFAEANSDNIFRDVINKYYSGKIDRNTVDLIKRNRG